MSASTFALPEDSEPGLHVAIIMDGNGRWATRRGKPRAFGHRAGAKAAERVVEAALSQGVGTLTLYAFSSDNWTRPQEEVATIMRLMVRYLRDEAERAVTNGVAIQIIGRRDRLPENLVRTIVAAEARTAGGAGLTLRIALDYSARDAIVRAAERSRTHMHLDRETFAGLLGNGYAGESPGRDVDLLIRTGGERRLSDFLLWECAYAELHFTTCMWPEFGGAELAEALGDFRARDRRFGGLEVAR